jgi:hypothetical protein
VKQGEALMSEQDEARSKYFADIEAALGHLRARYFEYEKLAIDYSTSAFKTMTYLHGGALVALPAAIALFKVDVAAAKVVLVVLGLIAICLAQACAFFTMARRSEAQWCYQQEQRVLVNTTHYPTVVLAAQAKIDAKQFLDDGNKKIDDSDYWRSFAIGAYWLAVILFLIGCAFGAKAVLVG